MVSGVVALILEANPALTYRDVQGVVAVSASLTDPSDPGWVTNGAGFRHNIKYGFGMVSAAAAVAAAQSWSLWGSEERIEANSAAGTVVVPSDGTPVSFALAVPARSAPFFTEWVEIYLNMDHISRGDLQLELTSPSGTHSVLIPGPRPETSNPPVEGCSAAEDSCSYTNDGVCDNPQYCNCDFNDCQDAGWIGADGAGPSIYQPRFNWKMTTVRSWGESPVGTWTLMITDQKEGNTSPTSSTLRSWNLLIYGHATSQSSASPSPLPPPPSPPPSPPPPLPTQPSPPSPLPPPPSPPSTPTGVQSTCLLTPAQAQSRCGCSITFSPTGQVVDTLLTCK